VTVSPSPLRAHSIWWKISSEYLSSHS